MEKYFQPKDRRTSVRTKLIAGMTTFFGDASNPLGVSYCAIYIATVISAVVGTILAIVIMPNRISVAQFSSVFWAA